jgi:hypothetical protein
MQASRQLPSQRWESADAAACAHRQRIPTLGKFLAVKARSGFNAPASFSLYGNESNSCLDMFSESLYQAPGKAAVWLRLTEILALPT